MTVLPRADEPVSGDAWWMPGGLVVLATMPEVRPWLARRRARRREGRGFEVTVKGSVGDEISTRRMAGDGNSEQGA
jgi:hypothetical protein